MQVDFVWHKHEDTDELFLVNKGVLRVDLSEGSVHVMKGQMFIVPKGLEHMTHADEECELIMFEPETTLNTAVSKEKDRREARVDLERAHRIRSSNHSTSSAP